QPRDGSDASGCRWWVRFCSPAGSSGDNLPAHRSSVLSQFVPDDEPLLATRASLPPSQKVDGCLHTNLAALAVEVEDGGHERVPQMAGRISEKGIVSLPRLASTVSLRLDSRRSVVDKKRRSTRAMLTHRP